MDAEKLNETGNKMIKTGVALLMLPVLALVAIFALVVIVAVFQSIF